MSIAPKISKEKVCLVKKLYCDKKYTMLEVAHELGVSLCAVEYCMRKNNIPRRSLKEAASVSFAKKEPSFCEQTSLCVVHKQLKLLGLALYWCEGYKSEGGNSIDFTNSDPSMVKTFMNFLRMIYHIDENRLRIQLYCYADQNVKKLMNFWSKLCDIPKNQFKKPYVRQDFRINGRKMKYGLVHIRYADKKLFLSIMKAIEELKAK